MGLRWLSIKFHCHPNFYTELLLCASLHTYELNYGIAKNAYYDIISIFVYELVHM